jgi:hypothetical protein
MKRVAFAREQFRSATRGLSWKMAVTDPNFSISRNSRRIDSIGYARETPHGLNCFMDFGARSLVGSALQEGGPYISFGRPRSSDEDGED